MKKNVIIALVSVLMSSTAALAAQPTDGEINRYYAALSGEQLENTEEIKNKRNSEFESDLEMLEAYRALHQDQSPEELMSGFFEARLGAIVAVAKENK